MALLTVYRFCATLALAGAALFCWGLLTKTNSDYGAAYELLITDCDEMGRVAPHWHERIAALRTVRWPLMDSGGGLMLLAATLFGLVRWNIGMTGHWCVTPLKRWYFFAVGIVGLGLGWFGEVAAIWQLVDRHMVPSCADSPGIPLIGITAAFLLFLFVGLVGGLLLMRGFAPLPLPLLAWDGTRPTRTLVITLCLTLVFVLFVLTLADALRSESSLAVPGYVLLLYLVEATRSALVGKKDVGGIASLDHVADKSDVS
ncbi:MAG: hypothetical protein WCL10_06135 [Novosphingobium sp.]|uniref:hypothetical protein n=1 Tax=Novosphingobium sp. TaxID=1874826 RepID=UPI003019D86C